MATLRDLVRRFRPAGTPGSAAPVGVPADRAAALAAELAPVFAALCAADEQADALLVDVRRDAEERRRLASEHAEGLRAEARRGAERLRADAALAATEAAAVERELLLEGARLDAAEIASRGAERLATLVDRVVAVVRGTGAARERVP